jgi:hypothetical protein
MPGLERENMDESKKAASGLARALLVDAHVHIYDCFDLDALFDAAARNFSRAAARLGVAAAPREEMLLLTETVNDHVFEALASGALRPSRWKVSTTPEAAVLKVTLNDEQPTLWVVAGRQIATIEDLEVLALGTTERFPDGEPIAQSLAASDQAAAMTALPWGFGKWWGQRGTIIQGIMTSKRDRPLYAGDNGGRLAWSTRPRLLTRGESVGVKVLPGTDPLPFAGQESRVGGYGMMLPNWDSAGRPLQQLTARLAQSAGSPVEFGGLTGMASFVRLQIAMQMRKRRRGSAHT